MSGREVFTYTGDGDGGDYEVGDNGDEYKSAAARRGVLYYVSGSFDAVAVGGGLLSSSTEMRQSTLAGARAQST